MAQGKIEYHEMGTGKQIDDRQAEILKEKLANMKTELAPNFPHENTYSVLLGADYYIHGKEDGVYPFQSGTYIETEDGELLLQFSTEETGEFPGRDFTAAFGQVKFDTLLNSFREFVKILEQMKPQGE